MTAASGAWRFVPTLQTAQGPLRSGRPHTFSKCNNCALAAGVWLLSVALRMKGNKKSKSISTASVEALNAAAQGADRKLEQAQKLHQAAKSRLKATKKAVKAARKAARKAAKAAKKAHKALRAAVKQTNQPKRKTKPKRRPARKAAVRPRLPKTVDELLLAAPIPTS